MIETIINSVLKVGIMVFITVMTKYIIPWFKNQLQTNQLNIMMNWTKSFVSAAEQLFPNKSGEKTGEVKLQAVTKWVNTVTSDLGVTYTEAQVRSLIEDAVRELKETETK